MGVVIKDNVSIMFCGDFATKDPDKIILSDELKALIQESDLRCLNFEGAIAIDDPVTIKGTANLSQSKYSPSWCESNGFNVISLANNHMGDYGQNALKETIKAFKSSLTVGAGSWSEAYQVKRIDINGLKIGFISLAQCEFGVLNDNWEDHKMNGCAWINHRCVNTLILTAKQSVDYLFVITHAGIEFSDVPLPEWRDRYKEFIDLGADGVIGGHPHVPQGWELYNGKPILYSLGNFYFDFHSDHEEVCNGLTAIIRIDNSGQITLKVINTKTLGNKVVIDTSYERENHNEANCQRLVDHEAYMKEVNKLCLELWPTYERSILRALNSEKTSFGLRNFIKYAFHSLCGKGTEYRYVLNYMRCESVRFVIIRALKKITQIKI